MGTTHRWLLVVAATLVGCQGTQISDRDIQMIGEKEVAKAAEQKHVAIIDVRSADAYEKGHIPGAINIFLPDIQKHDPRLNKAQKIIVYGSGRKDRLSTAAAKKMMKLGYQNVREFKGGLQVWKDAGREVAGTKQKGESKGKNGSQGQS